jgi:hypothetical protein
VLCTVPAHDADTESQMRRRVKVAQAAKKNATEAAAAKKEEEAVRSLLCTEHVCAKLGWLQGQCAVVGHGDVTL